MKTLDLEQMKTYNGGDLQVSALISGACLGWGTGVAIAGLAVSGVVGWTILGACVVNGAGGAFGWW